MTEWEGKSSWNGKGKVLEEGEEGRQNGNGKGNGKRKGDRMGRKKKSSWSSVDRMVKKEKKTLRMVALL